MIRKPVTPARFYRMLRDQLGSIRGIYLGDNKVTRRGDLGARSETVLLLHGFMQTRNVWEVMEDRLRYDGYGVFSFNLGGLLNRYNAVGIDQQAIEISEKIEKICDRYGLDRFHVIGHSMGGLIARHYVQHHNGDRRVKSLITLGTPHHGTPTAAIGVWLMAGGLISKSPLQMLPRSRFTKLLAQDTFPGHIPLTSIYSTHDLVCPFWCSVLAPKEGETGMKNARVRRIGHTALCFDPGVYLIIQRELAEATRLWEERSRR